MVFLYTIIKYIVGSGDITMERIAFIDTEIQEETLKLLDIGVVRSDGVKLHNSMVNVFSTFVQDCTYIVGHNIVDHDLKYVGKYIYEKNPNYIAIDTLYLSPLLFPMYPHHNLIKDDKILSESLNNPLNDALKSKDLFYDEVSAYKNIPLKLQQIYCSLLHDDKHFQGFFKYVETKTILDVENEIKTYFKDKICSNANLVSLIFNHPVELAYSLSLINANEHRSVIPPWLTKNYPLISNVLHVLRNVICEEKCSYCKQKLDVKVRLKISSDMSHSEHMMENLCKNVHQRLLFKENLYWLFFLLVEVNLSHSNFLLWFWEKLLEG